MRVLATERLKEEAWSKEARSDVGGRHGLASKSKTVFTTVAPVDTAVTTMREPGDPYRLNDWIERSSFLA